MKLAIQNLKTHTVEYFAGYDVAKPLLIRWSPRKLEATELSRHMFEEIAQYLSIRFDFSKYKILSL